MTTQEQPIPHARPKHQFKAGDKVSVKGVVRNLTVCRAYWNEFNQPMYEVGEPTSQQTNHVPAEFVSEAKPEYIPQVGDTVRIVQPSRYHVCKNIGATSEVIKTKQAHGTTYYQVAHIQRWFSRDWLVKIESESEFQLGDTVKVNDTHWDGHIGKINYVYYSEGEYHYQVDGITAQSFDRRFLSKVEPETHEAHADNIRNGLTVDGELVEQPAQQVVHVFVDGRAQVRVGETIVTLDVSQLITDYMKFKQAQEEISI